MSIIDLTESGSSSRISRGAMVDDVRHRLIALASVLESEVLDEAELRLAAYELDALVHRIRWIADVTAASDA